MATDVSDWLEELTARHGFSSGQRRIAQAIERAPGQTALESLSDLAQRAAVDASTVVRFAQSLGYSGWPAMQQELRARFLAQLTLEETRREHSDDPAPRLIQSLTNDIRNLQRTAETLDPEVIDAAAALMLGARSILVVAFGSSLAPATVLAHLGATLGLPFQLENRGSSSLAASVARLTSEDCLVVVGLWRPQRDIVHSLDAARANGVPTVAFCDLRSGPLARLADVAIVVPSEGITFVQSVTAATSVAYGLIAELEARRPDQSRDALARTQRTWGVLDVYADTRLPAPDSPQRGGPHA